MASSTAATSNPRRRPRLRILITAGPTREFLDPVRFISNASSGKMGYALAEQAQRRGHRVTLVSGPVSLRPPKGVRFVGVETTGQMARAAAKAFRTCDAAIFVAAVCDYRPRTRSPRKLSKRGGAGLRLNLVPTQDIAAILGRRKGRRVCVAFALETPGPAARARARRKLAAKRCDAVVLNRPAALGADAAEFEILETRTARRLGRVSKAAAAVRILARLEALWRGNQRS